MSYGMATLAQDNTLSLHSDLVNSLFFKTAGTYVGTASIPSSNFLASFGVSTPINPVTWRTERPVNMPWDNVVTTCGAVAGNGLIYYQPAPTLLSTSAPDDTTPTLTPDAAYVHAFGSLASVSGYGFSCAGPNSLAISPSNRTYCVHPASSGVRLRQSTASGLAMPNHGITAADVRFTQPTGPNIIFDKPYDNPPLIFITASSGPISLGYMTRDASGKYIGASVNARKSITSNGDFGVAYWADNTYSFTYFIVSDESPVYGGSSDYGIRVFDANGGKLYDSSNFMPNFLSGAIQAPYSSLDSDGYYRTYGSVTFTKSESLGVCINNLNPFTGYGEYISFAADGTGFGPLSFFGRYLQVSPTSAAITGDGTGSFLRCFGYLASVGFNYNRISSFDFVKSNVPSLNILFASHYL